MVCLSVERLVSDSRCVNLNASSRANAVWCPSHHLGPPNLSCKENTTQKKSLLHPPQPFILFKTSWGLHFWLKMIWFWLPTSFGTSVWRAPFWTVTRPCGAYPPGTTMALETSSQTRRSSSGRTTFPDWDGWYVANSNKIGGWIFWLVQGGTNDGRKRVRWNKSCCWGGYCSSWRWRHG